MVNERASLGIALTVRLEVALRRLVDLAKSTKRNGSTAADDPVIRDRIGQFWSELQALRFTNYRSFSKFLQTGMPGPEGSTAKLVWSETNQQLTQLAAELLGPEALLAGGHWSYELLRARGNTIEGGTTEILKNIVAERVLNLPRLR